VARLAIYALALAWHLRRTFGTDLAALKVPPHIVERLINHKFGAIQNQTDGIVSAVAEVYNRHLYMVEMREAIGVWEARFVRLLEGFQCICHTLPLPTRIKFRAHAK
jgi:hypothetical protein